MIAESLLLLTLGVSGGTAYYFYRDHVRNRIRREEQRREEERQREQELAELRAEFRRDLIQAIKADPRGFDFEVFADEWEMPLDQSRLAADELVGDLVRKALADGVLTESEKKSIQGVARRLLIEKTALEDLLRTEGRGFYRDTVLATLRDGVVSGEESNQLDRLRRTIGLTPAEASALTLDLTSGAYFDLVRRAALSGEPTEKLTSYLDAFRRAFGGDRRFFASPNRERFLDLHRELVSEAVQDGEVTAQEERTIAWLRREADLDLASVTYDLDRLEQAKRLASYRRGELPVVKTTKILEGGETCHFDAPCRYFYETRTKQLDADGELVVTSKRIIFISPTKSFDFSPSKILDLSFSEELRSTLLVKASSSRGNGGYQVRDIDTLEAVLCGIARKHKFLHAESYTTERSRHIPGDVKRAVWDRDGGRCVQCRAADYLEFDHIIPHTKGGANTVNNVQLLCRKCNNLKRDRI